MTKALRKNQSYTYPPLKDGEEIALSNAEKAEVLTKNFEKQHRLTKDYADPEMNEIMSKLAN